jgi:hypothetical protein
MMCLECDRVIKFIVYESIKKLTFVKLFVSSAFVGEVEMIKMTGLQISKPEFDCWQR